jgi:hypothetical protein
MVTDVKVAAVAVLKAYEYVTAVFPVWELFTAQLSLVSAPAANASLEVRATTPVTTTRPATARLIRR